MWIDHCSRSTELHWPLGCTPSFLHLLHWAETTEQSASQSGLHCLHDTQVGSFPLTVSMAPCVDEEVTLGCEVWPNTVTPSQPALNFFLILPIFMSVIHFFPWKCVKIHNDISQGKKNCEIHIHVHLLHVYKSVVSLTEEHREKFYQIPSRHRCLGGKTFAYLGLNVSTTGNFHKAVNDLRDVARRAFYTIKRNIKFDIPTRIWLKILQSVI